MSIKWVDIKKQKPKNDQEVLIAYGQITTAAIADYDFYGNGQIRWNGCHFSSYDWDWDFRDDEITHWAPMPNSPCKKNAADDKDGITSMNVCEPLSILQQEAPMACFSCHKKDFKIIDINFEDEDLCIFAECKSCGVGCFFIYERGKTPIDNNNGRGIGWIKHYQIKMAMVSKRMYTMLSFLAIRMVSS